MGKHIQIKQSRSFTSCGFTEGKPNIHLKILLFKITRFMRFVLLADTHYEHLPHSCPLCFFKQIYKRKLTLDFFSTLVISNCFTCFARDLLSNVRGHNKHSTVIFIIPLTHAEVWELTLIAAGMSVVGQFVEPVVFGCYEEVPGQQGANAHQKEDDVHQTVRVLWSVAHSKRHCGMSGQELWRGTLILSLLVLLILCRHLTVAKSSGKIGGVEAGLPWLCTVHFHRQNTRCSRREGERKRGRLRQWRNSWRGSVEKQAVKENKKNKS